MAKVNPIPADYPRVIPYLCVDGAAAAIDWYVKVLGATERMRMDGPDGNIGHAEISIGDGMIMLSDEWEAGGVLSPKKVGGISTTIMVYVEDVDSTFAAALAEGATQHLAVEDKFYGDRSGSFTDPFGHLWHVSSHIEDVPPEEMEKRAAAAAETMSGS